MTGVGGGGWSLRMATMARTVGWSWILSWARRRGCEAGRTVARVREATLRMGVGLAMVVGSLVWSPLRVQTSGESNTSGLALREVVGQKVGVWVSRGTVATKADCCLARVRLTGKRSISRLVVKEGWGPWIWREDGMGMAVGKAL